MGDRPKRRSAEPPIDDMAVEREQSVLLAHVFGEIGGRRALVVLEREALRAASAIKFPNVISDKISAGTIIILKGASRQA